MPGLFGKAALGAMLAAATLVATSAPALARHRDGDDDAAIAIGAGIVGLAIGAAIASDDDDRRYRRHRDYYYDDYPRYRGGYYDYDRHPRYRGHYRDYRHDRYDRYDRHWRGHGRDHYRDRKWRDRDYRYRRY